jgi:hypothetical protein
MTREPVCAGQVLREAGDPIRRLYSPVGAVVVLMVPLAGGAVPAVATVGDEGIVGAIGPAMLRSVVLVDGTVYSADTNQVLTETDPNPAGSGTVIAETYAYEAEGNQTDQTDANGVSAQTTCTADELVAVSTQTRCASTSKSFPMIDRFLRRRC